MVLVVMVVLAVAMVLLMVVVVVVGEAWGGEAWQEACSAFELHGCSGCCADAEGRD